LEVLFWVAAVVRSFFHTRQVTSFWPQAEEVEDRTLLHTLQAVMVLVAAEWSSINILAGLKYQVVASAVLMVAEVAVALAQMIRS
jgi:hypothetical protein